MRAKNLVPYLGSGLIALWTACGGESPAPQVCPRIVQHLPDVPEDQRVTAGKRCVQDSDCKSGFCDRGACGDNYWKGNYGRECVPGPSPPRVDSEFSPSPGEAHITPFGRNLCIGYLCLDGRCRSCQSDAECQWDGSAGPKCLEYLSWGGKRCGTVAEANLEYGIVQSPAPAPPPLAPAPPVGSALPPKP